MIEKECEHCGKKFNVKRNNQKFCSKKCGKAKIKCAECGKEHKRKCKNPNGEYICSSCYEKYVPLIICAECGKEHKKHSKNPNGEYICSSCYEKYVPLVICAECNKEHKRLHKNPDGEYVCSSCYGKYRPDVPLVICVECGKEHKRHNKNSNGEYVCDSCYNIYKCKKIIDENMQYYNFKNENDIDLFLSDMKKKYPHTRMYRQLECELLGYGNYNKAMDQAMKRDNYTCQITGKKSNVVVHHLNSYNTHKELACDLDNLISLDADFHKLYHDICGRGDNTEEQFWKFVEEYKKGLITLDNFKE